MIYFVDVILNKSDFANEEIVILTEKYWQLYAYDLW